MELKPNKKRLRLWAKALESGKYAQRKEQLRTTWKGTKPPCRYEYCCLGVAVEVYNKHADEPVRLVGSAEYMPKKVAAWYGVARDPELNAGGTKINATSLNDDFGRSFKQIAAAIRKTFSLK